MKQKTKSKLKMWLVIIFVMLIIGSVLSYITYDNIMINFHQKQERIKWLNENCECIKTQCMRECVKWRCEYYDIGYNSFGDLRVEDIR